jgi:ubiquinone/menaquinone biosynthesis C-methylase UbiE
MSYYDQISEGYDELHKEEQLKKLNIIKEFIHPKKMDTLLDVGCGSGISTSFWDCDATGLDPSVGLLKKTGKGKYFNASAENIPFEDKSFDFVISITAIQNFTNIRKGLEEMKRVGKGKFAFSVLKKSIKIKIIDLLIKELFKVKHFIEEDKDFIYIIN